MPETFTIKRGDNSPALGYRLPARTDMNLTGATAVFNMTGEDGVPRIVRAPAIVASPMTVDDRGPVLHYRWAAGDTAVAGSYLAEFEVTYADSSVETFPGAEEDNIHILIGRDLG